MTLHQTSTETPKIPDCEGWIYALPACIQGKLVYLGNPSPIIVDALSHLSNIELNKIPPLNQLNTGKSTVTPSIPSDQQALNYFINLLFSDGIDFDNVERTLNQELTSSSAPPASISIALPNPISPFAAISVKDRLSAVKVFYTWHKTLKSLGDYRVAKHGLLADDGVIYEVIGNDGYLSTQNTFTLKEKLKSLLYGKYFKKLFLPNLLLCAVQSNKPQALLIESILDDVEIKLGIKSPHILKWLVLLGKAILLLEDAETRQGYVMVVTDNSRTIKCRREEFLSLGKLKAMDLDISQYIPSVYPELSIDDKHIFLMEKISGMSIEGNFKEVKTATQNAVEFLIKLHTKTYKASFDAAPLLDQIQTAIFRRYAFDDKQLFISIVEKLKQTPQITAASVFVHGDFKLENLLFDTDTLALNGVIDWELSIPAGFLLIDILYLIFYNRSKNSGFDMLSSFEDVDELLAFDPFEQSILDKYCGQLKIDQEAIPYFCAVFYLHHIGVRFLAANSDENTSSMLKTVSSLLNRIN